MALSSDGNADYSLREVTPRGRGDISFFDLIPGHDMRVILVHGYNTTERRCVTDCGNFRKELGRLNSQIEQRTFTCTWKGDVGIPLVSMVSYPVIIHFAKRAGRVLYNAIARWQADHNYTRHIVIIAHSLGSRVVLEALKHMQAGGVPQLTHLTIILMAAAVPVGHVKAGGDLAGIGRAEIPGIQKKVAVFHSDADTVLSLVFRPGQFAGLDLFSEAVGLHGNPDNAWSVSTRMEGYGHGTYWKSAEMARHVVRLLGLPLRLTAMQVPVRATPGRTLRSIPMRGSIAMRAAV